MFTVCKKKKFHQLLKNTKKKPSQIKDVMMLYMEPYPAGYTLSSYS